MRKGSMCLSPAERRELKIVDSAVEALRRGVRKGKAKGEGKAKAKAMRRPETWPEVERALTGPGKPFNPHTATPAERLAESKRRGAAYAVNAKARKAEAAERRRREFEVAPAEDREFARMVQEAVDDFQQGDEGTWGRGKVFISAAWEAVRDMFPMTFGEMSLQNFKRRLPGLQRQGLLMLSRADLVAAMDPNMVRESEVTHLETRYNFIQTSAYNAGET